jgi:hypothetical protein
MQSVLITTKIVSFNPDHGEGYSNIMHSERLIDIGGVGYIVFKTTFNNISAISWWSVL